MRATYLETVDLTDDRFLFVHEAQCRLCNMMIRAYTLRELVALLNLHREACVPR